MIYYIITIFTVVFLVTIIRLIIKEKLLLKYSILWIIYSIGLVIMSVSVGTIEFISTKLGIYYAPALIFLSGLFFLMIYSLHLSIVISKQNKYITNLVQEVSLINNKLKKEGENKDDR